MAPELDYYVVEVCSDYGTGVCITILCNGKRIIVNFLPPKSLGRTIEGPLIERFHEPYLDEENEGETAVLDEIQGIVLDVAKPLFYRLAPPVTTGTQVIDLHSLLYPETFYLRFATVNDKAEILEDNSSAERYVSQPRTIIDNDLELPRYSSKDIQVLEMIRGRQGEVTRVLVDGREMCCKCGEPFEWEAIVWEYDCLSRIEQFRQHGSFPRVPKLTGLVTSADSGQVVGILEEYIPINRESISTLRDVEPSIIPYEVRKKWASQIREMVDFLHGIDIVWGDGKPQNVLVHSETDDAWLINFGGGWTDEWVDEEFKETLEGDEQAVQRIFMFLAV